MDPNTGQPRDTWGSKVAFVLAAAGSAIGLGNIWGFPTVAGQNGGAAFLLIYLAAVALIGAPVMLAELIVGRRTQRVGAERAHHLQRVVVSVAAGEPDEVDVALARRPGDLAGDVVRALYEIGDHHDVADPLSPVAALVAPHSSPAPAAARAASWVWLG